MSEEKHKNDKRYETEWSFSFESIGKSIDKALSGMGGEAITKTFTVPKEAAQTAHLIIGGSIGRTTITALEPGSPNLFEAEIRHLGELEFVTTGDGADRFISLRPRQIKDLIEPIKRSFGQLGSRQELYMRVRVSPDLLIRLELHGGVGPTEFDLAQLNLTSLEVDGGVGPCTLSLPTTANPYTAKIEGGVGGITVNTPSTTHVRLDLEGSVGPTTLNISAEASLEIKLEGGVGGTTVNAAPGVAFHLEAESGIGSVNVPKNMRQLKESGDFMRNGGVWESEGYALSSKRVAIDYNGGIGGLRIKQDDIQIV